MNILEPEYGNRVRKILSLIGKLTTVLRKPEFCTEITGITTNNELPSLVVEDNIWFPLIRAIEGEVNAYCSVDENKAPPEGGEGIPKGGKHVQTEKEEEKERIIKMLDFIPKILKYSNASSRNMFNDSMEFLYKPIGSSDIDVSLAGLRVLCCFYDTSKNVASEALSGRLLAHFTELANKLKIGECIQGYGTTSDGPEGSVGKMTPDTSFSGVDDKEKVLERALLLNLAIGMLIYECQDVYKKPSDFLLSQGDVARLLSDESLSMRTTSLIFMNLAKGFKTYHPDGKELKGYCNKLVSFSDKVVQKKDIKREEIWEYMRAYSYFVDELCKQEDVEDNDDKKGSCILLIDHVFGFVGFETAGDKGTKIEFDGITDPKRQELLHCCHRCVWGKSPAVCEKNPRSEDDVTKGGKVLDACLSLIKDSEKWAACKDHIETLYRLFMVIHTNHIERSAEYPVASNMVKKSEEALKLILGDVTSKDPSISRSTLMLISVINIVKAYVEKEMIKPGGLRNRGYISNIYEAVKKTEPRPALMVALLELVKSSTSFFPAEEYDAQLFNEFPYDKLMEDIVVGVRMDALGSGKKDRILKLIKKISRASKTFSAGFEKSLQQCFKKLIDVKYEVGTISEPKLYYDVAEHLLDPFFECNSGSAFMTLFYFMQVLFKAKGFKRLFDDLGYEEFARMICNPALTISVFHYGATGSDYIVECSRDKNMENVIKPFFKQLSSSLNDVLDLLEKDNIYENLRLAIKEGEEKEVDGNTIGILQKISGLRRWFGFVMYLLSDKGDRRLAEAFFGCVLVEDGKGSFGVLTRAKNMFFKVKSLLEKISDEEWKSTHMLAMCGSLEELEERNSSNVHMDLARDVLMRGYILFMKACMEICSYSLPGGGAKAKLEKFRDEFYHEIEGMIESCKDNASGYMKLRDVLLSSLNPKIGHPTFPLPELKPEPLKNMIKRRMYGEQERPAHKSLGGNPSVTNGQ
jgi:hypothetical protein